VIKLGSGKSVKELKKFVEETRIMKENLLEQKNVFIINAEEKEKVQNESGDLKRGTDGADIHKLQRNGINFILNGKKAKEEAIVNVVKCLSPQKNLSNCLCDVINTDQCGQTSIFKFVDSIDN
jgi:hypothetical protein